MVTVVAVLLVSVLVVMVPVVEEVGLTVVVRLVVLVVAVVLVLVSVVAPGRGNFNHQNNSEVVHLLTLLHQHPRADPVAPSRSNMPLNEP